MTTRGSSYGTGYQAELARLTPEQRELVCQAVAAYVLRPSEALTVRDPFSDARRSRSPHLSFRLSLTGDARG